MRSVSRVLMDISLPVVLAMSLIAIYRLDSSASAVPLDDSRRGILDPAAFPVKEKLERAPERPVETTPDEPQRESGSGHMDEHASADPPLAETAPAPRENFDQHPEFVMSSKAPVESERPTEFLKREVPVATIPAAPPPLLQSLERPKAIEQVRFFKLEAEAKSVVFLVDASGSMTGDPFERAQAELARAIGELNQHQTFSVAFFNHGYLFMPGAGKKKHGLHKTTSETKSEAISWMQKLNAMGGTEPEPAIREAANRLIENSHADSKVIFLLTDGQFRPLSRDTLHLLQQHNIAVFTIGFDLPGSPGNLESIAIQTGGQYRSAVASEAPHAMFLASSRSVLTALEDNDRDRRLAAVVVAFSREMTYIRQAKTTRETDKPSAMELRFARKLPELLNDSYDRLRREVHHRLVQKAMGSNFGPTNIDDPAETELAVQRWKLWCTKFFDHDQAQILTALSSDDASEQWTAASVIRIVGWDVPDELITNLGRVSPEARQEIRAALQALAEGQDFGPESTANDEEIVKAVQKWTMWRKATKDRLEEERLAREAKEAQDKLAKLQKTAADKLRVGDMHWKTGKPESKEKARTLWKKIIQDFPGTPAASDAEQRLQQ